MPRIYLDAAPVIYYVQRVAPFFMALHSHLSIPRVVRVASQLTRLECRVQPVRLNDTVLTADFDNFFAHRVSQTVEITRTVIDRATEIRAQYNFKTPDSIHLAAAVESSCNIFLTGDRRLVRFAGITNEVV